MCLKLGCEPTSSIIYFMKSKYRSSICDKNLALKLTHTLSVKTLDFKDGMKQRM